MAETIDYLPEATAQINAPQDLNRYLKGTRPGIWVMMIAVTILTCGFITWLFLGSLEESYTVGCFVDSDGVTWCMVPSELAEILEVGTEVRCGSETGKVKEIYNEDGFEFYGIRNQASEAVEKQVEFYLHETEEYSGVLLDINGLTPGVTTATFVFKHVSPAQLLFGGPGL